jgi:ribosome-associated protein
MAKTSEVLRHISDAATACEQKKAEDITILELDKSAGSFTDYFLICSGSNPRQIQAISDEVEERLTKTGVRPAHVEGYRQAEWVLLDYVDFVVHVFSQRARGFYNLERLWKSARGFTPEDLRKKARKPARRGAAKAGSGGARKKTAKRSSRPRSRARS